MAELLLELGCEELPASFVEKAVNDLAKAVYDGLQPLGVLNSTAEVYGTPRRLIVAFADVADRLPEKKETVRGPSAKVCFDADGNPTQALLGFCRKNGIDAANVRAEGDYVFAEVVTPSSPTKERLPEILKAAIVGLNFEKSMRWGASRMRFARPIRWILAAFNAEPIGFEIEGVASGTQSKGHRFYAPETFEALTLGDLIAGLRARKVEPDADVRKRMILEETAKVAGGSAETPPALLDENTYLTEWPTAIVGEFPTSYLELPEPVLVTAMAKHERMFPVRGEDGKLLPRFVFIRNSGQDAEVRRGCEWVLNARFNDAKFFFDEDQKGNLDRFLASTENIVFQAQLGTVRSRADRLASLAAEIAKMTGGDETEVENARLAGLYAKADLSTGLVSELSSLQGVIGGEYARREGKPEPVCVAIASQYDVDKCDPSTPEGRCATRLLMADQLDKLAGYLGLGMEPTGSSDPFGLRRAVTFLIESAWKWDGALPAYDQMLEAALAQYAKQGIVLEEKGAYAAMNDIFLGRYTALLSDARHDLLEAAILRDLPWEVTMPQGVRFRLGVISQLLGPDVVQTATRPMNIVIAAKKKGLDYAFEDPLGALSGQDLDSAEGTQLLMVLKNQEDAMFKAAREHNADQVLSLVRNLIDPINRFFDNTMVMAEDEAVRYRRLTLCHAAALQLFAAGDFTKLVG